MKVTLFNSITDIVAQKGVLLFSESVGFYYLLIAAHEETFSLEKALIGFSLVLMGAIFEYLITIAKVSYLKSAKEKHLETAEKQLEKADKDDDKVLEEFDSMKPKAISAKLQDD